MERTQVTCYDRCCYDDTSLWSKEKLILSFTWVAVAHKDVFAEKVTIELSWTRELTTQKEGRVCVKPKSCEAMGY